MFYCSWYCISSMGHRFGLFLLLSFVFWLFFWNSLSFRDKKMGECLNYFDRGVITTMIGGVITLMLFYIVHSMIHLYGVLWFQISICLMICSCFRKQVRLIISNKNIAKYYLRKERAELKEYCKILIKKWKSQIRRILQKINQEMKELSKESIAEYCSENERLVIWKIFRIIICS